MNIRIIVSLILFCQLISQAAKWPISNSSSNNADIISSPFGPRQPVAGEYQLHWGMDISTSGVSKPVHSILAGTVRDKGNNGSAGNWIAIDHTDGSAAYYFHLSSLPTIAVGASVSEGALIGNSGNSGTTFYHLHIVYYPDNNYLGDFTADQHFYSANPLDILPYAQSGSYGLVGLRGVDNTKGPYLMLTVTVPPKRVDFNKVVLSIADAFDYNGTQKDEFYFINEVTDVPVSITIGGIVRTYTYTQTLAEVDFNNKNNIDFGNRVGGQNQSFFNGVEIIPAMYTSSSQTELHEYKIKFYLKASALENIVGNIGYRNYDVENSDGSYSPYSSGWTGVFLLKGGRTQLLL